MPYDYGLVLLISTSNFFRIGEARESLRWLRGKKHDARKELEEFQVSKSKKEEIGSISLIRW